jgi:hypothetical protein
MSKSGTWWPTSPRSRAARSSAVDLGESLIVWVLPLLGAVAAALCVDAQAEQSCLRCHASRQQGFSAAHAALARDCTRCHAGDPTATSVTAAHRRLVAFPGDMDSAAQACGGCHGDKVTAVTHSLMNTGAGMVATARAALGEATDLPGHNDLAHLTHNPADSLLRKLCASCHLGQKRTAHRDDATRDRGGGCLACHVDLYPAGAHPSLSARVSDARCFGCHARSGRISLSYTGLGETGAAHANARSLRLEDGRAVEALPDDVHHAAGMGCTDCHTEVGVMGIGQRARHDAAGVDIACDDCHANRSPRLDPARWPTQYSALLARVPFPVTRRTRFLVTGRNGTPLWNIEVRVDGAWLYPKQGGAPLQIPPFTRASHPLGEQHRRLSCSACHSRWAPQCYSCHLSYDPNGEQWDHAAGAVTRGAWRERHGEVRNVLPPLGVDSADRIVPVVPGMIMTVRHPAWPKPCFVRRFAPLSPHTTGVARSCKSCHRSPMALGLGSGRLAKAGTGWRFTPAERRLADGLPADAWTRLGARQVQGSQETARPLSTAEMWRILGASLDGRETSGRLGRLH